MAYSRVFVAQPQQERLYSSYLELDLAEVVPCISGPKRYAKCFFLASNCSSYNDISHRKMERVDKNTHNKSFLCYAGLMIEFL